MNRSAAISTLFLLTTIALAAGCASEPKTAGDQPSVFGNPEGPPRNLSPDPMPNPGAGGEGPIAGAQPGPVAPEPGPLPAPDDGPAPQASTDGGMDSDAGPITDAGIGGDGGTQGDAGTGSDSGAAPTVTRSAGCGMAIAEPTGTWTTDSVSTGGGRSYDVRLPPGYDAATAYPAILLLHGCGSPTNNVPMEQVAGDSAIVVRGSGTKNGCWHETASGADLPYLDAVMEAVQSRFCVDSDHLFAVGYSSGSWLASTLSCHRGDMFRGIATVTGGEPSEIGNCVGQHGRMYIHDTTDSNNRIEWDTPSRDRMLQTNHCSTNTAPFDPSPCVEYEGCDPGYPVVWCATNGQGHSRQDSLAPAAFWGFFQRLMRVP